MQLKKVYHELVNVNDKTIIAEAYIPDGEYIPSFPGLLCLKKGQRHAEDFDSISWDIPQIIDFDQEPAIIRLAIKTLDAEVNKEHDRMQPARAEYKKIRQQAFWDLFANPENRNPKWR